MSGAIGSEFGTQGPLISAVDKLNQQNDMLTAQSSSGMKSDAYSGLGVATYAAISLEPQITATDAWNVNLNQVQTRLSATQSVLSEISSMASNLSTSLLSLPTVNSTGGMQALSATAKQDLSGLTALLNTRSGTSYLFAGTASDQVPVAAADLASSTLVANIINSVANIGTSGAVATETATLASALDNTAAVSVFSPQLSVAATAAGSLVSQVQVGTNETMADGIVATQGGVATTQSTGSPIRDMIRILATVAGFSGADTSSVGFQTLLSDTSNQLETVMGALGDLTANVGTLQATASVKSSSLADLQTALQMQLNTAKEVDPATVRTQQVEVQNQLMASYNLIADMKGLSLAHYL